MSHAQKLTPPTQALFPRSLAMIIFAGTMRKMCTLKGSKVSLSNGYTHVLQDNIFSQWATGIFKTPIKPQLLITNDTQSVSLVTQRSVIQSKYTCTCRFEPLQILTLISKIRAYYTTAL